MTTSLLLCVCLAGISLLHAVDAASTCCATINVNIRSGPSTRYGKVGLLTRGRCLPTRGLSSSRTWVKVVYGRRIRYIYKRYCPVKVIVPPLNSRCCATTNVNIRSGPSTRYGKVGLLTRGRCLPTRGLSGTWVKVVYGGRIRYIYKRYCPVGAINPPPKPNPPRPPPATVGCPNIIPRSQWGARGARRVTRMRSVPGNVYVHHTTGSTCSSSADCKKKVRGHQNFHMDQRRWSDIAYSFLIGEDGNVYEGRGWRVVGGHTKGHNSDGYGIAFIGDFTSRNPNARAQSAFHRLIRCGISTGQLRSNYVLKGHRDVRRTACPGNTFYNLVRRWPHYKNQRG